jgi:hypothetical protein
LEGAAHLGHSLGAVGVDGPKPPIIQRQELPEEEEEELQLKREPAAVQRQEIPEEEEEELQLKREPAAVQRQEIPEEEEEELQMRSAPAGQVALQRQELPGEEEELMMKRDDQRVGPQGGQVPPEAAAAIRRARGGGRPLTGPLVEQMSASLGHDFSGVRVHTDAEADALNQQLQAKAFTSGSDIFFRRGEYTPGSLGSRELIAHELSHAAQQNRGSVRGDGSSVTACHAGDALDVELHAMARKAAIVPRQRTEESAEEAKVKYDAASLGCDATPLAHSPRKGVPAPIQEKRNKTGLSDALKAGLETLSGLTMNDVQVHYNSARPARLQALAYTQGRDIYVGTGQERYVPHEAWHVVQQKQGRVRPTRWAEGVGLNDDAGLEREAVVMGGRVALGASYGVSRPKGRVENVGVIKHPHNSNRAHVTDGSRKVPPPIQAVGGVELRKRQFQAREKNRLLKELSSAIQMKLSDKQFLDQLDIPPVDKPFMKAVKVNQALRKEGGKALISGLLGRSPTDKLIETVAAEFKAMPEVKAHERLEDPTKAFAHYTKEGYEAVTGVAKGGFMYEKLTGRERKMTEAEMKAGVSTLKALVENWAVMPKFQGTVVYRVVHKGTGIGQLNVDEEMEKANPTSTSVALDWSRVGEDKTCCVILISRPRGTMLPVDTRVVSTYMQEAEILLPPGTRFKKKTKSGDYERFEATMPSAEGMAAVVRK